MQISDKIRASKADLLGSSAWLRGVMAATLAAGAALPSVAMAQDVQAEEGEYDEEIVVTGTLVRGIAPAGTNVIGVGAEDVQETGATTTSQLLQTIPQLGAFNSLQFPAASGNTVTVNRPNLRDLPGNTTAGGSTTLVLLDGHRVVGMGVTSTTPDPDVIPPGAIERLEIVPDGGSAIYGADAVAGVLNFITRKKFDGLAVDGRYGFADDYYQWDVNATVGRDWGDGGIYVSYAYAKNDDLFGRDRDFIKGVPDNNGLLTLNCNPGNISLGGVLYGLPSGQPTPTQCDPSDNARMYPANSRHSVFARFTQDLNDSLNIDIQSFYTNRKTVNGGGFFRVQNPLTRRVGDPFFAANQIGTETSHSVLYGFGGTDASQQNTRLSTFGITPTLTADLGSSWQLRVMGNYGESTIVNRTRNFNPTALTNAINAGLFNPYAPDTSNQAALDIIYNFETYGRARQILENARFVLDGDLFDLPGGAVKLAVGGEYIHETFTTQAGTAAPGAANLGIGPQFIGGTLIAPTIPGLPRLTLDRKVKSVFGEAVAPIFETDNGMSLTLSAAARYDDYNDVGSTFNPKFGATFKPAEWLSLRAAWGESFNAPSLADAPQTDAVTLFVLPAAFFSPTADQIASGQYPAVPAGAINYVQRGNSSGTVPQEATTMSLGADVEPVSWAKLSVTYWKIDLKGVIGIPDGSNPAIVYGQNVDRVTVNPSADLLNAVAGESNVFPFGPPCHTNATPCNVYAYVDIRKGNLGDFKTSGLDFNVAIDYPTSFGAITFDVNANYILTRKERAASTGPFFDRAAANTSRFKSRAVLGAQFGETFSALATWNHTHGYDLDPVVGFVPQSKVSNFDVFNLFFRYDVPGEGIAKDLSFTLGIDNVFDTDPPEYRRLNVFTQAGSGIPPSGFNTLGRLVQVGVAKKF